MTSPAISLVRVWLGRSSPEMPAERGTGWVCMSVYGPNTANTAAILQRLPASSVQVADEHEPMPTDEHLVARLGETDPSWLSAADVIVIRVDGSGAPSRSLIDVRARLPGCLVIALDRLGNGCLVETRTGWRIRFVPGRSGAYVDDTDVAAYASLVHTWMASGRSLAALDGAHIADPTCFATGRRVMSVSAKAWNRTPPVAVPEARRRVGG